MPQHDAIPITPDADPKSGLLGHGGLLLSGHRHRQVDEAEPALGSDWADALLTLPMVLPPTVLGYYLIVLMGRRGVLGAWLQQHLGISLMFTWQGAVLAAAVAALPLVLKSARAAFESVDAQVEQAARTLGASEWSIFLRISLPLAWRGILAGVMLAFARAMGNLEPP